MRRVLVIGIGAGDPEQITVQAIKALNRADVFFVMDKGSDTRDLMLLRQEICERYVDKSSYRMVHAPDPRRDRAAADYGPAVLQWRRQRSEIYQRLITDELAESECGAFLVWGDPALYDSTLAIIEQVVERGEVELEYEVIPGISSVQALAARHRVSLTQVGKPLHITTGRLLAEGLPEGCDDVVVMLDSACSFSGLAEPGIQIYWGAYVGTKDEILVSGNLGEVSAEIRAARSEARARKGWIMDTYLLRRTRSGTVADPAAPDEEPHSGP
jgi:precorrin-6A synthase